jgi:hypothetical protein
LRIGTPEALDTLEYAVERLGAHALEIDAKMAQARRDGDKGTEKALNEERHRYLWTLTELRVYGLQHTTRTKVVPFLRRFIEHTNCYVMHEVLTSLQNIDVEDAGDVVLDIIRSAALAGEDWFTLMELQRTVVAMGRQLDANALVTLLRDDDVPATVKESAVAALGATGDPRALAPLTDLVERGQFTIAAIQALGELGDPGALSTLTKLLQRGDHMSQDRRVALEIELTVQALGRLHDSGAYAPLEGYARVLWPNVSHSLVEAVVASGRERAIPLLVELWAANRDQRRAILSGLLWIGTEAATSGNFATATRRRPRSVRCSCRLWHRSTPSRPMRWTKRPWWPPSTRRSRGHRPSRRCS